MSTQFTIRQGDCLSNLAAAFGFFPDTIWNHDDNAALRELRQDPNILAPGDVVVIPERELGSETCAGATKHSFRRKGVPEYVNARILDEGGEPRASVSFAMHIDGSHRAGVTDPDGWIREPIPPNAAACRIELETGERFDLELGTVDPIGEVAGVQKRLENLGFSIGGDRFGELSDGTAAALAAFQESQALEVTGEIDDATRGALETIHGA